VKTPTPSQIIRITINVPKPTLSIETKNKIKHELLFGYQPLYQNQKDSTKKKIISIYSQFQRNT
jgi:AAA+ ATPase superfamily predicted ATPase